MFKEKDVQRMSWFMGESMTKHFVRLFLQFLLSTFRRARTTERHGNKEFG